MRFCKFNLILLFTIIFSFSLHSEENILQQNSADLLSDENSVPEKDILKNSNHLADRYLTKINKNEDNEKLMNNKKMRKSPEIEYWPEEELKINSDTGDCLFSLPEAAKCAITVGYFNYALSILKQPRAFSESESRKIVLRLLLTDYYRINRANSTGFSSAKGLEQKIKITKEQNDYSNKLISYGPPIRDSKILSKTYDQYYEDYFKEKSWREIEILGSSDSIYIDSVYSLLKSDTGSNKKVIIPTIKTVDTLLSSQIRVALDSLPDNTFTKPIKTSFGFFTIRTLKTEKRNEIAYKDALNQVRLLATRDYYRNTDSLLTEKAYRYYKNNKEALANQDTFNISTYLLPPQFLDSTKFKFSTANFRALHISSDSLPEEIRFELVRRYFEKKDNTIIGPISSAYGFWFFKIDSVRKSNSFQSFYLLKSKLVKKVHLDENENENIPEVNKERFNNEHALGILFNLHLSDQINTADKKDLMKLSNEYGLQITDDDLADEKQTFKLREQLIQKNVEKENITVEQWLQTININ